MTKQQNVPSKSVKTPKETRKQPIGKTVAKPADKPVKRAAKTPVKKPKPSLALGPLGYVIQGSLVGQYVVWAVPEFIEKHLIYPYALNDFRAWLQTTEVRQQAVELESGRSRWVYDCANVVKCLPNCLAPLFFMDDVGAFENTVTRSLYLSPPHVMLRFGVTEEELLNRCFTKSMPVGFGLDQVTEDLVMGFWLEGLEEEFAYAVVAS